MLGKIIDRCKYIAHDADATNGTETAVAALWGKVDASGGNPPAVSLVPVPPLPTATISSSPARRASQRLPRPMSRSRPRATPLPLSSCRPSGRDQGPKVRDRAQFWAILSTPVRAAQDCRMGEIGATTLGELSNEIVDVVMAEISVAQICARTLVGRSDHAQ